jgi:hypothetical protein
MTVAGAAGAAGVAAAAVGLGALYTAHSLRSVMATPPQSEEPGALQPLGPVGPLRPSGPFDCAGLLGGTSPDLANGEFYACLRHMLYSSRPLYVHCKDPTWRDDAVIAAVNAKLKERETEEKAKVLSRLTVLLTLRCARPFRQKLREVIQTHVAPLASRPPAPMGPEEPTPPASEAPLAPAVALASTAVTAVAAAALTLT